MFSNELPLWIKTFSHGFVRMASLMITWLLQSQPGKQSHRQSQQSRHALT